MNRQLLDRLKQSPQLPSLPVVAVRVLELARRSNVKMDELTRLISSDPALSAKVLKTVNSSFYGLPQQVSTINRALVLLGMQSVKTLALGFSLAGSFNSDRSSTFDYTRFWKQSLYSAVSGRTLARVLGSAQVEEAFLAGLLSDIGTLVMHKVLGTEYDVLLAACGGDQIELVRLSRQKFDLDHAQVGGMLAEHWKLPPVLIEPIRQHHELTHQTTRSQTLPEIVHASVLCGQVFAAKIPGLLERARQDLRTHFELSDQRIHDLFTEIDAQTVELADLFEITFDGARSYQQIQDEARQALIDLSMQAQMQSREMAMENQSLQHQAATDGLTGLANRAYFNQFLEEALAESSRLARPLALLFLDVDKFKVVNDTHGHQAGDLVLQCLGELLGARAGKTDLAARYGGEEFVLIMPGRDSTAASAIAEEIRRDVMQETIAFDGNRIPMTVSIGVAGTNQGAFASTGELIDAADQAMYAAKAAGRNRVQVHGAASRISTKNAIVDAA